jgi:hypothetical protein
MFQHFKYIALHCQPLVGHKSPIARIYAAQRGKDAGFSLLLFFL